jgi:hypothetical protein
VHTADDDSGAVSEDDSGAVVEDDFGQVSEDDSGQVVEDDSGAASAVAEDDSGLVAEDDSGAVVEDDFGLLAEDDSGAVVEDDSGAASAVAEGESGLVAEDDSGAVSQGEFKLPRALLNLDRLSPRHALDPVRTPVSHRDPLAGSRAEARASSDEFEDVDAALSRTARLWRDHPLRTAAIVAGVALISYFGVDGARNRGSRSPQTLPAPAAALSVPVPIVEQLSEARQPLETEAAPLRGKQTVGRRAPETPFAGVPAGKDSGDQAIVSAQAKSRPAERSSTSVPSSSAGLPAWGAESLRAFSEAKSSKAASMTAGSQAHTAKPASSSADVPPPLAADPRGEREQPKPALVVAAKPAEPPEPLAPPRPNTPLTMEQMLNQVEEAAQARRKKEGLKAPRTSQRDAELDELINSTMASKKSSATRPDAISGEAIGVKR